MELKKKKILVVDDEEDILEIIGYNLENEGFEIETAKDGLEAIRKAKEFLPDLILLDIMMPKLTGTDVIKVIKREQSLTKTRIIFLTALGSEASEIEGLDLGADDYIIKPIKPKLLLSRINSVLRRNGEDDKKVVIVGELKIDLEKYTVFYRGTEIKLTKKEFKLIKLLASKPERVFLREEILTTVWDDDTIVGDRTIDVHIRRLRQKLDGNIIKTVKGVGYKITSD